VLKKSLLLYLILLLPLVGCEEKSDNIPAFANPNAPEYRALTFFDAIYNNADMELALKYSTKQHARIIKSYGSVKGYSRYVLNLQFDTGVDLKIDRTLSQVETTSQKTTSVNILFSGFYHGNKINDLREVKFEKVKGQWLISKIAGDPYARR